METSITASDKQCACGLSHRLDEVKPIFIQPGAGSIPALIAFHCECRSTLSVTWPSAPHILRQRAIAAEAKRNAGNLIVRRRG